jgi:hypothetical protein
MWWETVNYINNRRLLPLRWIGERGWRGEADLSEVYSATILFFIYLFIWFVRLLALRPLLAYCASLGWLWRWLLRSRWNVDWHGKPKFSEKTCPSATFVHHKIPHDHTLIWTRAAAVGSRRLTAWAMARPTRRLRLRVITLLHTLRIMGMRSKSLASQLQLFLTEITALNGRLLINILHKTNH